MVAPQTLGWNRHTKNTSLIIQQKGMNERIDPVKVSITEMLENTIQYVSHCLSSPTPYNYYNIGYLLQLSMALILIYAGQHMHRALVKILSSNPIAIIKTLMTMNPRTIQAGLETFKVVANFYRISILSHPSKPIYLIMSSTFYIGKILI